MNNIFKKEVVFVFGGAGFIGHHLARKLKNIGKFVVVFDIKSRNEYCENKNYCDEYVSIDLSRNFEELKFYIEKYKPSEIYQLACMMGGAGFIFTGKNDFEIMVNSASIATNLLKALSDLNMLDKVKVFFSSSACVYPSHNQEDPSNPNCREDSAYPASPDSEYGWEKLFSERLYLTAARTKGFQARIARFHNIFGIEGTYTGGKEKFPAAICRKVSQAVDGDTIEIWGPGTQTRSFLYVDECIEGILKLMNSNFTGPVNIGSTEMISIADFSKLVIKISGKKLNTINVEGPIGVNGRNSDNRLILEKLNWEPSMKLEDGIKLTYSWINNQIKS